ncbi:hypothetical protein [Haliangium sp.]|uniref:hypothetical protein n=1 Tax=Haliangium sp. TaxID=2663208 RepID=UPI003D0C3F60
MVERDGLILLLDVIDPSGTMRERGPGWAHDLALVRQMLLSELEAEDNLYERQVVQIGGRSVLFVPLESAQNLRLPLGWVFRTMMRALHLQAELCTRGVFFGGLLALGKGIGGPEHVVGAGVEYVVRRHARLPGYPRIVVDDRLLHAVMLDARLRHFQHGPDEELEYIQRLVERDGDGFWYVDYVGAIERECDSSEEYEQWLARHRDWAQAKLNAVVETDDYYAAWHWLAWYHNRVVRELPDEVVGDEAARVDLSVLAEVRPTV